MNFHGISPACLPHQWKAIHLLRSTAPRPPAYLLCLIWCNTQQHRKHDPCKRRPALSMNILLHSILIHRMLSLTWPDKCTGHSIPKRCNSQFAHHWATCRSTQVGATIKSTRGGADRSMCISHGPANHLDKYKCEGNNHMQTRQTFSRIQDMHVVALASITSAEAALAPHTVPKSASIRTCSNPTFETLPAASSKRTSALLWTCATIDRTNGKRNTGCAINCCLVLFLSFRMSQLWF